MYSFSEYQSPPIKDEVVITYRESVTTVNGVWTKGSFGVTVSMKNGGNYKGQYDDHFSLGSFKDSGNGHLIWFESPVFTDPNWNRRDYWTMDIEDFNHDIYMIDFSIQILRLYKKHNPSVTFPTRIIDWVSPITKWI